MSVLGSKGPIVAPINIAEPFSVMGLAPKNNIVDVGYAVANAHKEINMWSKNKPMRHSALWEMTEAQKRYIDYGLVLPMAGLDTSPLPDSFRNAVWTYNAPTGGAGSPYRTADWIGYRDDAPPPVAPFGDVKLGVDDKSVTFTIQRVSGRGGIDLSDFHMFDNCYLCIVIYTANGGFEYKTSAYPLNDTLSPGAEGVELTYEDVQYFKGELTYMLCAFSEKKTDMSAAHIAGNFLVLPSAEPLTGKVEVNSLGNWSLTSRGVMGGSATAGTAKFSPVGKGQDIVPVEAIGNTVTMLYTIVGEAGPPLILKRFTAEAENNFVGATTPKMICSGIFLASSGATNTNITLTESDGIQCKAGISFAIVMPAQFLALDKNGAANMVDSSIGAKRIGVSIYYDDIFRNSTSIDAEPSDRLILPLNNESTT